MIRQLNSLILLMEMLLDTAKLVRLEINADKVS